MVARVKEDGVGIMIGLVITWIEGRIGQATGTEADLIVETEKIIGIEVGQMVEYGSRIGIVTGLDLTVEIEDGEIKGGKIM